MSITAVAYYRTSSSANVGDDRDSLERQRLAVTQYASRYRIEIVREYYDAAVKGTDAVDVRPGFAEMITYMNSNGAKLILVESASRFARDLIVQETGYAFLKRQGFTLIAVDDPDAFTSDTPTAVMIRQILGAVSQFEKASIVAKLAGARVRARAKAPDGRCEGPKQAPEPHRALAKALKAKGLPLRAIADRMAQEGFLAPSGRVYGPESIKRMIF